MTRDANAFKMWGVQGVADEDKPTPRMKKAKKQKSRLAYFAFMLVLAGGNWSAHTCTNTLFTALHSAKTNAS